jgi:hypothetical protein
VFENRILRGIFGPKAKKITGDWKERLKKSFTIYRFLFSKYNNLIKSWVGHVAHQGWMRSARKTYSENNLGKPMREWEDNIKMDLRGIKCDGPYRMHLAQDRDQWWAFVKPIINLRLL